MRKQFITPTGGPALSQRAGRPGNENFRESLYSDNTKKEGPGFACLGKEIQGDCIRVL